MDPSSLIYTYQLFSSWKTISNYMDPPPPVCLMSVQWPYKCASFLSSLGEKHFLVKQYIWCIHSGSTYKKLGEKGMHLCTGYLIGSIYPWSCFVLRFSLLHVPEVWVPSHEIKLENLAIAILSSKQLSSLQTKKPLCGSGPHLSTKLHECFA
jgi:hypothetical protein